MDTGFLGNEYARSALSEYFRLSGVRSCLLYGPTGIGKFTFLREQVRMWGNRCFILGDGINIQMMREIKLLASLNQQEKIVCILDHVDTLNEDAQSAFLKTLEEAPHMVFCVVTSNLDALLPTIQSRIPAFYFSPCSAENIKIFVDTLGSYNEEETKLIIKYSAGRPGVAKMLSEDIQKVQELDHCLSCLSEPNIYKRLGLFHELGVPLFEGNPKRFIDACILDIFQKDAQRTKDLLELKQLLDSNINPIFQFEHYLATH